MNAERVTERGLSFVDQFGASLSNSALRFNKQAKINPKMAYANVVYAKGDCVEGVAYQLSDADQILKMDYFEGSPVRYSRELFWIKKTSGESIAAWVYIANEAMLKEGLQPAQWYLEHLLKGEQYLSTGYFEQLKNTPTIDL